MDKNDEKNDKYYIRLFVKSILLIMILYQSYLGLNDKVNRIYFEYRLVENIRYMIATKNYYFYQIAIAFVDEENFNNFEQVSSLIISVISG